MSKLPLGSTKPRTVSPTISWAFSAVMDPGMTSKVVRCLFFSIGFVKVGIMLLGAARLSPEAPEAGGGLAYIQHRSYRC